MTEMPATMTYSSIIMALNDIDVNACNIGNAYLHVPCKEKIWVVFDAMVPLVDETYFVQNANWTEFYHDAVEDDPPGMPATGAADCPFSIHRCRSCWK